MRIAIDANVLDGRWGGIPKYIHRVSSELLAGGDEIVLLANARQVHHGIPGAEEVGIRVRGGSLWRHAFLPLWLARGRVDVLWAPESILPRWSPGPAVITVHDLAALRFPGVKPPEHVAKMRQEVARSARRATRVITVSEATAGDVRQLFEVGGEKVRVVPNGVDDAFSPGDRDAARAAVAARWGISAPFVLHVGSLEPRKGLDVLIEAAATAARDGAPWRVALAGSAGFEGERIEAAARASDACDLLGHVEDSELLELMRGAAAFAAPALNEGFGIAPLEAMACGTPAVIAADSGGLEEVSGPAAIVVAERRPAAWREALERAMERPADLVDRGLRHAGRFRWPAVAARTREVLAEAAANRAP
jgi:glycosyltransferase involved in cell wall biosynthesis